MSNFGSLQLGEFGSFFAHQLMAVEWLYLMIEVFWKQECVAEVLKLTIHLTLLSYILGVQLTREKG